jgi:hypothetical protein
MKKILSLTAAVMLAVQSFAGTTSIYDENTTVTVDGVTLTSGTLSAMWGSYSAGVFTPFVNPTPGEQNLGYVDVAAKEFAATLALPSNTLLAAGTPMFLAVYNLEFGSTYHGQTLGANTVASAVLTDAAWIAPTFTLLGPEITWALGTSTSAVFGSYSFNAGANTLGLVAIPEPSTYALIFGAGVLGLVMFRRFRK